MRQKFKIPLLKINHGKEELSALKEVAESGWWTIGPKTKEFEETFADYVDAKFAVFVNSATEAIFLSLEALQIKGATFKVPSLTFTASAAEIIHSGNTIEFIDVNRKTVCAEGQFSNPLLKVHYGGNYSNAEGSSTVEDSSHLIKKGQCKGSKNLVCFSFAYSKNITTAEGGMIATNDQAVYEWLIKARFFGINRFGILKNPAHLDWPYEVEFLGWKGNTSEFHAALGLVQLKKLESVNARRKEIVELYNKAFNYDWQGEHLYPVFVPKRVEFLQKMQDAGIQCSVHYIPLHWMKAYEGISKAQLPNTEWLGKHLVTIPLFPDLINSEVEYIIETVKRSSPFLNP